ncbi:unnamed protein product [Parnassius mnemosyne]|uniref:Transcription factor IIIC 90kDa subunit N-terminal domain-containing protein n=1 Tax=Parnassius mnemosyne TaxID=213953 RepID=A0AAV1L4G7_9NEOP
MLHEITKLHIYISKIYNTNIVCHNSLIAVCSDKGIHIIDYSYNLQCYDKKLDYFETMITAPKYSPVSELFENSFVKNGVRNSELVQMILDPTLWPHNNQLLNEMTSIAAFEWSPINFIGNMDSAIAVLTNVGCVELFGPNRLNWSCILNLSLLMKNNLKELSITKALDQTPTNAKELQEAAHALATTAICWADKINKDHSCYFVTAQKNGFILFWLLRCQEMQVEAKLIGHIESDLEILHISWVPLGNNKFLIITSDTLGKVFAYVCTVEDNLITCLTKEELWQYRDKMIAKHFNYIVSDENIILLYSKHRHFVVQMFDKNCKLKSQEVTNINDYKITDIKKGQNNFYLSTINNKLHKIEIHHNYNTLKIQTPLVEIKESYPTSELHGIGFSANGALCMLALIDRKVLWRKEPFKIDLLFLINSTNNHDFEVKAILNNPSSKLTNQWDNIEILRYKTMKTKMLPNLDYKQLLAESDIDIYNLKVYYILLKLYNNLESLCKNSSKGSLPETSVEVINDRIHASYASSCIENIHKKYKESNCILEDIDSETIYGAKAFLDYYCHKYKKGLPGTLDPSVLEIFKTDHQYICQCCDKEIEGFSCKSGHLNMFCSLTFTPIESDNYLVCKACGSLARTELLPNNPTCVFCDLFLSKNFNK